MTVKNCPGLLLALLGALALPFTPTHAEEAAQAETSPLSAFSLDATLDLYSAYIFRGIVYDNTPVYQPGISLGYDAGEIGSFSVGAWANASYGSDRPKHDEGVNEIDYTVSWSRDFGALGVEAGYCFFTFPGAHDDLDVHELFTKFSYHNDIVTPYTFLAMELNRDSGAYAQLGLTRDFALIPERLTLTLDGYLSWGSAAYNRFFWGEEADNSALDEYVLTAALSYALTEQVSLGATVGLCGLIDGSVRDSEIGMGDGVGEDIYFWGGVNLGVSL